MQLRVHSTLQGWAAGLRGRAAGVGAAGHAQVCPGRRRAAARMIHTTYTVVCSACSLACSLVMRASYPVPGNAVPLALRQSATHTVMVGVRVVVRRDCRAAKLHSSQVLELVLPTTVIRTVQLCTNNVIRRSDMAYSSQLYVISATFELGSIACAGPCES